MRGRQNRIITVITIGVLFLIWLIITSAGLVESLIVPSPKSVAGAFLEILEKGYKRKSLLYHLGSSLYRLLAAFALATIVAVPLGLLAGFNEKARAVFEPIVDFIKPLPPLAYYTLLVLWLGIGNESKIALLFVACFAPIFIASIAGVTRLPKRFLNCAYSLGASNRKAFRKVIFPAALPSILVGMRTALGVGYTTLISSEMVAATSGIGWMVLDASRIMRSDVIFVGIFLMGFTGILMDVGLRKLEKKLVPWNGKE